MIVSDRCYIEYPRNPGRIVFEVGEHLRPGVGREGAGHRRRLVAPQISNQHGSSVETCPDM